LTIWFATAVTPIMPAPAEALSLHEQQRATSLKIDGSVRVP